MTHCCDHQLANMNLLRDTPPPSSMTKTSNKNTRQLFTFDTQLTADCIEWCPIDTLSDVVVCGTYQLDPSKNQRDGRMFLFSNRERQDTLDYVASVDTTGIFDIKWSYHRINGEAILAQAGADASLQLYKLNTESRMLENSSSKVFENTLQENVEDDEAQSPTGLEVHTKQSFETMEHEVRKDNMCLSIDWNNRVNHSDDNVKLIVTQSNGNASLVHLTPTGLQDLGTWKAHNFEAWIGAFNYHQTFDYMYTGGDDALLKGWDSRMGYDTPTFVNKNHRAGVCSLQSHPHLDHILASGSYDERVCIWDVRMLRPGRTPLHEFDMGGGVWRLKWHKSKQDLLLAACMHNGFHILDINQQDIIASYGEHESLAYGVDWCLNSATSDDYVASCSFYDHSMHYWHVDASPEAA